MTRRTAQWKKIINYMIKGHSITPYTALKMFGCFRLSERIRDIERHFPWLTIHRAWYTSKNEAHVRKYFFRFLELKNS